MPEPVITAARTARHALPYLFPGQAQKEAFVNEALARLDALVHPVVDGERADPPASPAPGQSYVVGATPSGAWAGQAQAIATWAESQWLFAAAREGMQVHDLASDAVMRFSNAVGWQGASSPPDPAGGGIQDAEARAAISAMLSGLRKLGIFS